MRIRNNLGLSFRYLAVLCAVLQLSACGGGGAADGGSGNSLAAALSWTAPSQREDGSVLNMTEIAGYRVYYGRTEGNYPNQFTINYAYTMEAEVIAPPGVYYVVVTTVDTDERESAFSSPALKIEI